MQLSPWLKKALAGAALIVALLVVLVTTGPRPDTVISGSIRRIGGVCLQLERWDLFGWRVVGQTHTVSDMQNGVWHEASESPPCAAVLKQSYLVRLPFEAPNGTYRICGLADEQPCIELRRVPFRSSPGP
ncbi:MAG: hypothetical protein V3S26_05620 [Acidimicrobiia bacterium]|jgi:hypothetical protein